jgi:hypothetical protein
MSPKSCDGNSNPDSTEPYLEKNNPIVKPRSFCLASSSSSLQYFKAAGLVKPGFNSIFSDSPLPTNHNNLVNQALVPILISPFRTLNICGNCPAYIYEEIDLL